MTSPTLTRGELLGLAVLVEGGLGALAATIGWLIDVPPWHSLSVELLDIALGCVASVPMLVMFLACLRWPVGPLRKLERFADDVLKPMFRCCTIADLAIISLLAGVGEELLFRGLVQTYLTLLFEDWTAALILASLLFGLFHPISVVYFVLATVFGLYLGLLFWTTGNLCTPIVAHAVYDFVALVWLCRKT